MTFERRAEVTSQVFETLEPLVMKRLVSVNEIDLVIEEVLERLADIYGGNNND